MVSMPDSGSGYNGVLSFDTLHEALVSRVGDWADDSNVAVAIGELCI